MFKYKIWWMASVILIMSVATGHLPFSYDDRVYEDLSASRTFVLC